MIHCADIDLRGTVSLCPLSAGFSMVYSCLLLSQKTIFQVEKWGSRVYFKSGLNLGLLTYLALLV